MNATARLDRLIESEWEHGRELAVKVETATECAWWGELRWTPEPNRQDGRPDRSLVLYATGGGDPNEIIVRLLDEFEAVRDSIDLGPGDSDGE